MSLRARPYEDAWGPRRARIIAGMLGVLFTVVEGEEANADAAVKAIVLTGTLDLEGREERAGD